MSQLNNISFGKRLAFGFGISIVIFATVALAALFSAARLADADFWNKHTYRVIASSNGMLQGMVNMETGLRGYLLSGNQEFLKPMSLGKDLYQKSWNDAKELTADNPSQQSRLEEIKKRHQNFSSVADSYIAKRRDVTNNIVPFEELVLEFAKASDKKEMDAFRLLNEEFEKAERNLLEERSSFAENERATNKNIIIYGFLIAVLLSVGFGIWITRSITKPMSQALETVKRISDGDLTVRVETKYQDETGQLLTALNKMVENLAHTIGTVLRASDNVASASSQIASANQDLSSRTESQASSLQQTAASMEELGSTVKLNAENAQSANQLALNATNVASQGGEVVSKVVNTMRGINESSRQISEIIGVIDSIAFQTNILALNAAVEAARAGEQGRGFAVVASEVRNLAKRSADAAKEIKDLITTSVEQVEQGSQLADKAGDTMAQVVSAISRVTDIMGEISAASTEQSQGVMQVGEAVMQMDQVTQQNAALVEENAAAAGSLSSQANELVNAVAVFKLPQSMGSIAKLQIARA